MVSGNAHRYVIAKTQLGFRAVAFKEPQPLPSIACGGDEPCELIERIEHRFLAERINNRRPCRPLSTVRYTIILTRMMKRFEAQKSQIGTTLTVDEAHALIGKDKISRGGFYAAINRKEVPHLRLGKRIIIPRAALLRWLDCAGGAPT
jgi:excisionase family DNA binding protein